MQNINYNLLKVFHSKLDNVWRLEKHYLKDAKGAKCKCLATLNKILADDKKHIEMLKKEIEEKVKKGSFN